MIIRNAEILCVGTEILIGDIVNTNAAHISRKLADIGINQYYQAVVGDNPERLAECIKAALQRCDLLILSGGLGPTYDDLTKEIASECMGRELYLDDKILNKIKDYFLCSKKEMPHNNEKQAYVPAGAIVFDNDNGTAPGLAIEDAENSKIVVLLPGPPRELVPMFDNKVLPYLEGFSEYRFLSKNVNLAGIGESAIDYQIGDFMRACTNPTVAPYCGEGETRLRVTAKAKDMAQCEILCNNTIQKIMASSVGKYIYGVDSTLEASTVALLKKHGKKISFAESCTGGLLMKTLTDVPGASEVFEGGIVSYSERIKSDFVGVDPESIEKYGVVSENVARLMAEGIRARFNSHIGVGVTGYAGPDGGNEKDPVGTVYFAVSDEKKTVAKRLFVPGGERSHIRKITANNVFVTIIDSFLNEGNAYNRHDIFE